MFENHFFKDFEEKQQTMRFFRSHPDYPDYFKCIYSIAVFKTLIFLIYHLHNTKVSIYLLVSSNIIHITKPLSP